MLESMRHIFAASFHDTIARLAQKMIARAARYTPAPRQMISFDFAADILAP